MGVQGGTTGGRSPSGSFRDLLSNVTQSAEKMDVATEVQQEELPSSSAGSREKNPEAIPEDGSKGKGVVEDTSPRRSPRNEGSK